MPSKFASCDTFVFITDENQIIFGKNADRPQAEVQEIVYFQAKNYAEPNSKLKCTYIQIDQAEKTNAIILSKPSWMWGAESGSNEYGVVIGNEAIVGLFLFLNYTNIIKLKFYFFKSGIQTQMKKN